MPDCGATCSGVTGTRVDVSTWPPSWRAWASKRALESPIPARGIRRMRSLPPCCVTCISSVPITSGRRTVPTFRCGAGLSPCWLCSTGPAAPYGPGAYRTRSPRTSVLKRCKRRGPHTARRPSSTPTQAAQFTRLDFTGLRKDHGIQISRDGTGCWRDHVFVERLGKSVNYEDVYLSAYDSGSVAQPGLVRYRSFYNPRRPHSALDRNTPDECYDENLPRLQHAVEAETGKAPRMNQESLSKQMGPPLSAS